MVRVLKGGACRLSQKSTMALNNPEVKRTRRCSVSSVVFIQRSEGTTPAMYLANPGALPPASQALNGEEFVREVSSSKEQREAVSRSAVMRSRD